MILHLGASFGAGSRPGKKLVKIMFILTTSVQIRIQKFIPCPHMTTLKTQRGIPTQPSKTVKYFPCKKNITRSLLVTILTSYSLRNHLPKPNSTQVFMCEGKSTDSSPFYFHIIFWAKRFCRYMQIYHFFNVFTGNVNFSFCQSVFKLSFEIISIFPSMFCNIQVFLFMGTLNSMKYKNRYTNKNMKGQPANEQSFHKDSFLGPHQIR